jgi:hypothetical protein
MEYQYPEDFSESARARVELEIIKAQQQLQSDLGDARLFPSRMHLGPNGERAFDRYVLRVFLSFVEQACDLGRVGRWDVPRVREESEEFLRIFTIFAFYRNGEEIGGRKLTYDPICHHSGAIVSEVMQRFQMREEWVRYQEQLVRLAELASQGKSVVRTSVGESERLGVRRAKLVQQLIAELNTLKPLLLVPDDDFPRLSKQYQDYEIFKICKANPAAIHWVKLAPDRPRVHTLAYEIAAIRFNVSQSTIKTAWKRHKSSVAENREH